MNRLLLLSIFLITLSHSWARESLSFNDGWKFARFGPMPDGSQTTEPAGMDSSGFDDAAWRTLNLPHDWGIEGPFRKDLPNRTGKLPWPGIGWYRKSFHSPESDQEKRVFVEFDGAMSGTTVWVNGAYAGEWPYGYSSFRFEITAHLKPGADNTIAVRLDNKPESSRWYPGGGIYRNVRIVRVDPIHVDHWGVFVTTPEITPDSATVEIRTALVGAAPDVSIRHEIFEPGSDKILTSGTGPLASIKLPNPKLWNLETPNIYQVKTFVSKAGKEVDSVTNTFGVRSIKFTTDGFFLNGEQVRFNGVCQHSDLGPLGMAVNTRAMERQIQILKNFGCNSIRTAHNPPDPAFLDLCDRMGVLVIVESFDTWRMKKTDNDYAALFGAWHERDIKSMVRRDRNHPSVIMWSTGNEVLEQDDMANTAIVRMLENLIRDEDPTRPTTFGCSKPDAVINGFGAAAEIMGVNYKPHLYGEIREKFPHLPFYASETTSCISSRGEYFFPVSDNQNQGCGGFFQVSDYGLFASPNGYPPDVEFAAQDRHPYVIGEFVWTGFDYIGEPTPYNKDKTNLLNYPDPLERARVKAEMAKLGNEIPPRSSYFGIVDLCGFPKDRFYQYQSRWRPELPMAHILPHWNWPERVGQTTPVHVYTSGNEAELFLNGKSLGRRTKGEFEYRLRWDDVIYAPGELKVLTFKDGKPWAEDSVTTTGAANRLDLSADRPAIAADGADLSFVTVRIADASGETVPRTHNPVKFTLTGPGEILAIGNGDPTDLTSFQAKERKVFNGLALVIIRSEKAKPGSIELLAESSGLPPAKLTIISRE